MLLPTVLLYRDPPGTGSGKTFTDTMMGALEVLGDSRFMLMVVVYSGFWILYFQNFGTVLFYLRDFVDREPVSLAITSAFQAVGLPWTFSFDVEHVTVINAGTIILLQVVVSRIVKSRPALGTMVTGMAIGALGFLCLAASMNAWVFVLGIAVFSIGEMTAHPKYYSFVGLVAPADRKAVYMGYAFLYGVFGALLGANIGAYVYDAYMTPVINTPAAPEHARLFWLGFAGLDAFAALGLILFARRFGQDTPDTRYKARIVMYVVYAAVLLLGLYFLWTAFSGETPQYRTAVQALIFVALGTGGLLMNSRRG
jgi:POT family proton-dependent oligopeptide transporter